MLAAHYNPKEMADLTLAIATINAWNRFAIGFRKMPAA
jgi:alkylhydroperoxidase family enzyme